MNDDHGKAKTIFLRAAEIAAVDERQAYLAAACGDDDALRSEVEDLLRHQQRLGSFLEVAPGGPATASSMRRWLASGSCHPVTSPSTARCAPRRSTTRCCADSAQSP